MYAFCNFPWAPDNLEQQKNNVLYSLILIATESTCRGVTHTVLKTSASEPTTSYCNWMIPWTCQLRFHFPLPTQWFPSSMTSMRSIVLCKSVWKTRGGTATAPSQMVFPRSFTLRTPGQKSHSVMNILVQATIRKKVDNDESILYLWKINQKSICGIWYIQNQSQINFFLFDYILFFS